MGIFDKASNYLGSVKFQEHLKYAFSSPGGMKSLTRGVKMGHFWGFKGGAPFVIGGGLWAAAHAKPGHSISAGVASATSFGITSLVGGVIGGLISGGNPIVASAMAIGLQAIGGDKIDKMISGTIQPMVDFGSNMRRQNFGGDYRDTQIAYTMRQSAAREMSRSLLNARQWLGQESAFMHQ